MGYLDPSLSASHPVQTSARLPVPIRLVALTRVVFFFSSRRRHTRFDCDWSSDVCSSDLATLVERLGAPWLAPAAALVALLLTLGNLGGVGAWIAGTARIPFVAGVDRVLPPAFGKVHPRWQTPYVALLVQGGVATVFVVAGLPGSPLHHADLPPLAPPIVPFFIPYLYLF